MLPGLINIQIYKCIDIVSELLTVPDFDVFGLARDFFAFCAAACAWWSFSEGTNNRCRNSKYTHQHNKSLSKLNINFTLV